MDMNEEKKLLVADIKYECSPPIANKKEKRAQNKRKGVIEEIVHLQSSTHQLIPKHTIREIIKTIVRDNGEFKISKEAVAALHCASEDFIIELMGIAGQLTRHRNREKLMVKDIRLAKRVKFASVSRLRIFHTGTFHL